MILSEAKNLIPLRLVLLMGHEGLVLNEAEGLNSAKNPLHSSGRHLEILLRQPVGYLLGAVPCSARFQHMLSSA